MPGLKLSQNLTCHLSAAAAGDPLLLEASGGPEGALGADDGPELLQLRRAGTRLEFSAIPDSPMQPRPNTHAQPSSSLPRHPLQAGSCSCCVPRTSGRRRTDQREGRPWRRRRRRTPSCSRSWRGLRSRSGCRPDPSSTPTWWCRRAATPRHRDPGSGRWGAAVAGRRRRHRQACPETGEEPGRVDQPRRRDRYRGDADQGDRDGDEAGLRTRVQPHLAAHPASRPDRGRGQPQVPPRRRHPLPGQTRRLPRRHAARLRPALAHPGCDRPARPALPPWPIPQAASPP